jgi:TetR/AcrR family transcriptional repressor of mexJK operon
MQRMMMMPGTGDRHVRELYWQAGPQRVKDVFGEFLRAKAAAGELRIDDVPRAASQFFCLLKGELHAQMLCGMCDSPSAGDVDRHIEATVELFLRGYGGAGAAAGCALP